MRRIRSGGLFMLTIHDWISGRSSRVASWKSLSLKSAKICLSGYNLRRIAKNETLNKKLEVRLRQVSQ